MSSCLLLIKIFQKFISLENRDLLAGNPSQSDVIVEGKNYV